MSTKTESSLMQEFTKSAGFILSGGYVANLFYPILKDNKVAAPGSWFMFLVGVVIFIFGVIHVSITPFRQKIQSLPKEKHSFIKWLQDEVDKLSRLLLPLIFVITVSEVINMLGNFLGMNLTIVGGIVIAIILIIGIIYEGSKSLFKLPFPIYFGVVFAGGSTLQILLDYPDVSLFIKMSLVLSTAMLLYGIYLMQKSGEKP